MFSFIDDLMKPSALPDSTENISLIQTHISFVLIADDFVYKIKKAVDFGFLDFSTLEKRKYYCNQEIDLNRRLAKEIYIGVLPIMFDGRSHKIGKGRGEVVEYAVKMKRIPHDLLMKTMFEKGTLKNEHIEKVARTLANFHLTAYQSSDIDKFGYPEVFKKSTDENFQQTKKYTGITIEKSAFDTIKDWTDDFFIKNRSLFLDRISSKKIRDCHGDLHMEHICLTDPISVFDCIEFNERFRYNDVLADIAFLLMDLEYRGSSDFADILWKYYAGITDCSDMETLLRFYKVYRAYVRGKVTSFQIDDENISPPKKEEAIQIAKSYFQLARHYII